VRRGVSERELYSLLESGSIMNFVHSGRAPSRVRATGLPLTSWVLFASAGPPAKGVMSAGWSPAAVTSVRIALAAPLMAPVVAVPRPGCNCSSSWPWSVGVAMVLIKLAHPTARAGVAGYRTGRGRVRPGRGGLAGRPAGPAAPPNGASNPHPAASRGTRGASRRNVPSDRLPAYGSPTRDRRPERELTRTRSPTRPGRRRHRGTSSAGVFLSRRTRRAR
jgi:hypothetical protein